MYFVICRLNWKWLYMTLLNISHLWVNVLAVYFHLCYTQNANTSKTTLQLFLKWGIMSLFVALLKKESSFENSFVRLSPGAVSKAWKGGTMWLQSWGNRACLHFCLLLPVCSLVLSVCALSPFISPSLLFTLSALQPCVEHSDMLMPSSLEKIKRKFNTNSEHEDCRWQPPWKESLKHLRLACTLSDESSSWKRATFHWHTCDVIAQASYTSGHVKEGTKT